jgi:hypothetical protein
MQARAGVRAVDVKMPHSDDINKREVNIMYVWEHTSNAPVYDTGHVTIGQ